MTTRLPHLPLALLGLAGCLASQTIQASLTALQPISLSQNGGNQVTHPAGPLTSANLSLGPSSVTVDLTPTTLGWNLESSIYCGFPSTQQSWYQGSTDMELSLSASAPTRAILRLYSLCADDGGGSISIQVPGYGSVSFGSGSANGARHVDHFLVDLDTTPLVMSVNQSAGGWPAGTSYLLADVELLSPLATPEAAGCGGVFYVGFQQVVAEYDTDHFLDLVDNGSATSAGTLRASALGQWSSFFVGFSPALMPLQLPAPFSSTCPTLSNIAVTSAGSVTSSYRFVPASWEIVLPLLPPGLTIYAQHGCAKIPQAPATGNILWNTSNVVRIDT